MKIDLLSVIVPVYKAEKTIVRDIETIYKRLKKTNYKFELLPVVDGILLDKSFDKLMELKYPELHPKGYKTNKGKGQAVRFGMKHAKGDIVMFIDAGSDIHPSGIRMLLEHMKWYNADIVVGSKAHPVSKVKYPLKRKIISYGLIYGVKILFGFPLKIKDTQTGIKAFRRKVLDNVLDKLVVKRFAFDIEILMVAKHSGFKKIFEAPVKINWSSDDTTIRNVFGGSLQVLLDTLAVWYRLKILKYYDDYKLREKVYDEELDLYINTGNLKDRKRQKIINFVNESFDILNKFIKIRRYR